MVRIIVQTGEPVYKNDRRVGFKATATELMEMSDAISGALSPSFSGEEISKMVKRCHVKAFMASGCKGQHFDQVIIDDMGE